MLLIQEYQDEISTLSTDLASARDQTGVFMSKEKYQALMDQMNRQKIAIDQEKVRGDRRLERTADCLVRRPSLS